MNITDNSEYISYDYIDMLLYKLFTLFNFLIIICFIYIIILFILVSYNITFYTKINN
jgi:hypothetical protein